MAHSVFNWNGKELFNGFLRSGRPQECSPRRLRTRASPQSPGKWLSCAVWTPAWTAKYPSSLLSSSWADSWGLGSPTGSVSRWVCRTRSRRDRPCSRAAGWWCRRTRCRPRRRTSRSEGARGTCSGRSPRLSSAWRPNRPALWRCRNRIVLRGLASSAVIYIIRYWFDWIYHELLFT